MYQGGSHIDVTYKDHPEIEIVEYFRCSGFIWEPVSFYFTTYNALCFRNKKTTDNFQLS